MAIRTQGFGLAALPQFQGIDPRLLVAQPVDLGGALEQGLRGFVLGRELDAQRKRLGMEEADAARRAEQFASEAPLRELVPIRAQAQRSQLEAVPALTNIEQGLSGLKLDEALMNIAEQSRVQEEESAIRDAMADPDFQGFANAGLQRKYETAVKQQQVELKKLDALDKEVQDFLDGQGRKAGRYVRETIEDPQTGEPLAVMVNENDPSDIQILGRKAFAPSRRRSISEEEQSRITSMANRVGILTTAYETDDEDGNVMIDWAAMAEDTAKLQALQSDRDRLAKDLDALSRRPDMIGFSGEQVKKIDERIQKLDEAISGIRGTPAPPPPPPPPMVSDEELQNAILSLPAF